MQTIRAKERSIMRRRRQVISIAILLAVVVLSSTAWLVYERGRNAQRLTVQGVLRLCSPDRTTHIGTVTVEGYSANVRVAFLQLTAHGLFPTQAAAVARSRGEFHAPFPPPHTAVWLIGSHIPRGTENLAVTGKLDCVRQLPGMGDSAGTFAWLTVRTIDRVSEKA
jgi:hypothetical protein